MIKKLFFVILFLFIATFVFAEDMIYLQILCDGPWELSYGKLYNEQPDKVIRGYGKKYVGPIDSERYSDDFMAILFRLDQGPWKEPIGLSIIFYTSDGASVLTSSSYYNMTSIAYRYVPDANLPEPKDDRFRDNAPRDRYAPDDNSKKFTYIK